MADPAAPVTPPWHALELQLLEALVHQLGEHGEPDPLLQAMLRLMAELLGLDRGRIVLPPPDGGPARIRFSHGLTEAEIAREDAAPAEGVVGQVLASGQALGVYGHGTEPRVLPLGAPGGQPPQQALSFLALPIPVGARTVGVLACHCSLRSGRTLDDDLVLLRILAALTGQRLQTAARPLVRPYLSADSHTAEAVQQALAEHGGHHGHAARALGLTQRQFNYRLRKARDGED